MRRTRLVIADRHPIVLQGLTSVFAAHRDLEIIASCRDGASCVEAIWSLAPDVALLEDLLPDLTASEILAIANAEVFPPGWFSSPHQSNMISPRQSPPVLAVRFRSTRAPKLCCNP